MRRGRRTILIAGATLASIAATGGCSSLRDDAASRSSLVMVGDSITFMSLEPLHAMFAAEGFTEVTVDAVPGRPIAEGVDIVELVVASGPAPDVWVVALGTNDLYYSTDVTAYRARVQPRSDAGTVSGQVIVSVSAAAAAPLVLDTGRLVIDATTLGLAGITPTPAPPKAQTGPRWR